MLIVPKTEQSTISRYQIKVPWAIICVVLYPARHVVFWRLSHPLKTQTLLFKSHNLRLTQNILPLSGSRKKNNKEIKNKKHHKLIFTKNEKCSKGKHKEDSKTCYPMSRKITSTDKEKREKIRDKQTTYCTYEITSDIKNHFFEKEHIESLHILTQECLTQWSQIW